jgi:hypothetical protein
MKPILSASDLAVLLIASPFLLFPPTSNTFVLAQEQHPAPNVLAAALLTKVQNAEGAMKQECGAAVFNGDKAEVSCKGHGEETVGSAWKRYLVAAGVPENVSDRTALAGDIGLDPQASLCLAGPMARLEAIEYLLSQLRMIAKK